MEQVQGTLRGPEVLGESGESSPGWGLWIAYVLGQETPRLYCVDLGT